MSDSLPCSHQWTAQDISVSQGNRSMQNEQMLGFADPSLLTVDNSEEAVRFNTFNNHGMGFASDTKSFDKCRYRAVTQLTPLTPPNKLCERVGEVDELVKMCEVQRGISDTHLVYISSRPHKVRECVKTYEDIKRGKDMPGNEALDKLAEINNVFTKIESGEMHRGKTLNWFFNGGCVKYSDKSHRLYYVGGRDMDELRAVTVKHTKGEVKFLERADRVCLGRGDDGDDSDSENDKMSGSENSIKVSSRSSSIRQVEIDSCGTGDVVAVRRSRECVVCRMEGNDEDIREMYKITSPNETSKRDGLLGRIYLHASLSPHIHAECAVMTEGGEVVMKHADSDVDMNTLDLGVSTYNRWGQVHYTDHPRHMMVAHARLVRLWDVRTSHVTNRLIEIEGDEELVGCVRWSSNHTLAVTPRWCYLLDDRFPSHTPVHSWNISVASSGSPHQLYLYSPTSPNPTSSSPHSLFLLSNQYDWQDVRCLPLNPDPTCLPISTHHLYTLPDITPTPRVPSNRFSSLITGICMVGYPGSSNESLFVQSTSLGDLFSIYCSYERTNESMDTDETWRNWYDLANHIDKPNEFAKISKELNSSTILSKVLNKSERDFLPGADELEDMSQKVKERSRFLEEVQPILSRADNNYLNMEEDNDSIVSSGTGSEIETHSVPSTMQSILPIDTSAQAMESYCHVSRKILDIWHKDVSN